LRRFQKLDYIPHSDDEDKDFQRPKHYGGIVPDSEDETFEDSLDDTTPSSEAKVGMTPKPRSRSRKRSKFVPSVTQHHKKRERRVDKGKLHPFYVRNTLTQMILGEIQVSQILKTLPNHTPKLKQLSEILRAQKWHSVERVPTNLKSIYRNTPELFSVEKCMVGGKPYSSALDLLTFCMRDADPNDYIIEDNATKSAKNVPIRHVLNQLLEPPTEGPLIVHNVILDAKKFNVSLLADKVTIPSSEHVYAAMNVTPVNTVVDVHIDQGTNGLSVGLGHESDPSVLKVHKIWFFWPPTEHNLSIYEELKRSNDLRLLRCNELEHGLIADFGINQGVFLPAGWLHATVTVRSGFLGGITINSPDTIRLASKLKAMDVRLQPWDLALHLDNYLDAIEVALSPEFDDSHNGTDPIEGWLELESSLRKVKFNTNRHRTTCSKILDAWKGYLERHLDLDRHIKCCACRLKREGDEEVGDGCCWCRKSRKKFRKHFWIEHLSFITPAKYELPTFAR
jgi:hypothetical protein